MKEIFSELERLVKKLDRPIGLATGRDKVLVLNSNYLGATKQMPYLIDELVTLMPEVRIYSATRDMHEEDDSNNETLKRDILRLKPALLDNVRFQEVREFTARVDFYTDPFSKAGLRVEFERSSLQDCLNFRECMNFKVWVDPLKFQRRPLLSKEDIKHLKESYNLGMEKVVMIGSPKYEELPPLAQAIRTAKKNNRLVGKKVVWVPRMEPEYEISRLSGELGLSVVTDKEATRAKVAQADVLVITAAGNLQDLYSIADVAFIGNTLWNTGMNGGQNPLEPAFYGKRIVAGNRFYHNGLAFDGLNESGLLTFVDTQRKLYRQLFMDVSEKELAGPVERANAFIDSYQHAARAYALFIREAIFNWKSVSALDLW